MSKEKPKRTLYSWFGVIGDIFLFPIILLSLLVCLLIFVDRRQTQMPSVFGYSLVRIMSGSMEQSGFLKGQNVFIKKTQTDTLFVGDIIAFYDFYDSVDKTLPKTEMLSKDQSILIDSSFVVDNRTTLKQVQDKKVRIKFHQIEKVEYDSSGTRFFVTKGTSNASLDNDGVGVRQDFVVGKYIPTSNAVRSTLNFVTSPIGMIILVCLPLGVLVILEALSLIEQINFIYLEKQLLLKKVNWKDKEVQRFVKTGEMEEIAKIIYLGQYEQDDKKELIDCLWHESKKRLSEKQLEYEKKLTFSFSILENNKDGYFLFWKNNIKSKYDKKTLNKYLQIQKTQQNVVK